MVVWAFVKSLWLEGVTFDVSPWLLYTPYEGLNLANQKSRKLEVFGHKLEGIHVAFYWYFDKYYDKLNWNNNV